MQPLAPRYYDFMDSVFKELEDEFRTTLNLVDDDFQFSILLPGKLISSNADTIIADTLIWNYSVKDFLNDDLVLSAKSDQKNPKNKLIAILLVVYSFFVRIFFLPLLLVFYAIFLYMI